MLVQDYAMAVESLQRACELLAAKFGDDASQCAEALHYYGKALLELHRKESDALNDMGNQEATEDDSSDENEGEEEEEKETEDKKEEKVCLACKKNSRNATLTGYYSLLTAFNGDCRVENVSFFIYHQLYYSFAVSRRGMARVEKERPTMMMLLDR